MQQGVGPGGSEGAKKEVVFRGTALPLKGNTTGIAYWLLATLVSYQMRHVGTLQLLPQGKHETLRGKT